MTAAIVTIVFDADIAYKTNLSPYYLLIKEGEISSFVDLTSWTFKEACAEATAKGYKPTNARMEDDTVHEL